MRRPAFGPRSGVHVNLKLESLAACPVCGGRELDERLRVPDYETATGIYGLVGCADCGTVFTSPRPVESDLPLLYQGRTTTDFRASDGGVVRHLRDFAIDGYLRSALGVISLQARNDISVLDYGCGDGALALGVERFAQARGLRARVVALDFDPTAPPALAGHSSDAIRYVCHDSWSPREMRFDVVFLRHVLEHHPDPRGFLGSLRDQLSPGGHICIELPNRRSVWAKVFGRHYFAYYVPRHLMHFDEGSLRHVVEGSGLRCVSLKLGHTPLLGRSIAYMTGWNIGNTGLLGLASYPIQVAVDWLGRSSSTLQLIATTSDA